MTQAKQPNRLFRPSYPVAMAKWVHSLREARIAQGITQEELAHQCNVSLWAIKAIESQRRIPHPRLIAVLGTALDVRLPPD